MKWTKIFEISSSLVILIAFMIPSCQATIEKEYEEYWYREIWWGKETKFFAFKVKAIVETERDGTWRNNTEYEVHLLVTLTYINYENVTYIVVNETTFNPWVEIVFGDTDRPWTLSYVGQSTGYLFFVKSPMPYASNEYRFDLNPVFHFYGVKYESPSPLATSIFEWNSPEPLYIDVTAQFDFQTEIISYIDLLEAQLNIIRNLMYILVATTIILIATTVYFAIRKPKIKP
jgi:hypothetical protein